MKRVVIIMGLVLLVASVASAQIAGSKHDLTNGTALRNTDVNIDGQTCIFCHTPHGGSLTQPLWNRAALTTTTYQTYTSSTMDAATPTSAQIRSSVSGACLSCHDGTIGVDVLTNVGGAAGAGVTFTVQGTAEATFGTTAPGSNNVMASGMPFMGTDLRNDHPISIIYETARAATPTEFATQAIAGSKITVNGGATGALPLYGADTASATVECASCHNPHGVSGVDFFLRKANTNSRICLTCHVK